MTDINKEETEKEPNKATKEIEATRSIIANILGPTPIVETPPVEPLTIGAKPNATKTDGVGDRIGDAKGNSEGDTGEEPAREFDYLVMYWRRPPIVMETEARSEVLSSLEKCKKLVEQEGVTPEDFIGIWKLGEPLDIKLTSVEEKEVQVTETRLEHKWE